MVTGAQQYSLPQLQDIIQLLPIAAVLLTPNAKILLANQHYADFFSKHIMDVLGQNLKDIDLDCYQSYCNDLRILYAGQTLLPFEHQFAGREYRLSFQAYYNQIQELQAVLVCAVDVSDLIARQRALVQDNQYLQQKLELDALTGLANRYAFQHKLKQQNALVVALLDLDDFKAVNDRYGHVLADRILVELGKHLNQLAVHYQWPIIYRVGGEEFVILFDQHTLAVACGIVDEIRRQVLALNSLFALPQGIISVSCGVAAVLHPFSVMQALTYADQAMYQAKVQGKNTLYYYQAGTFYPYV